MTITVLAYVECWFRHRNSPILTCLTPDGPVVRDAQNKHGQDLKLSMSHKRPGDDKVGPETPVPDYCTAVKYTARVAYYGLTVVPRAFASDSG